jgi:hypothetical protein
MATAAAGTITKAGVDRAVEIGRKPRCKDEGLEVAVPLRLSLHFRPPLRVRLDVLSQAGGSAKFAVSSG